MPNDFEQTTGKTYPNLTRHCLACKKKFGITDNQAKATHALRCPFCGSLKTSVFQRTTAVLPKE